MPEAQDYAEGFYESRYLDRIISRHICEVENCEKEYSELEELRRHMVEKHSDTDKFMSLGKV